MIQDSLKRIKEQLPQGVKLVAVSKFHPVERLKEAYDAGQRIFGENRPQELAAKVPQMPKDVQWHFIGHLQTNKLKLVLPYVSLVQSVDSLHLLEAIKKWAVENNKLIDILLELHLGAEETKHGFTEEEICGIVAAEGIGSETCGHPRPHKREGPKLVWEGSTQSTVYEPIPSAAYGVRIVGLMGMATNTDDMSVVEKDFIRIEALFNKLKAQYPQISELSIGMSGDWQLAVKHGATMIRIGTDIFGPREY